MTASTSYYLSREDDLGRSKQLHLPLNKGEWTQVSLAKVFDDPAMRPKVLVAAVTQRPNLQLDITDIEGTKCKLDNIVRNARGTDPNNPVYQLPSYDPPPPPSPPSSPPSHRNINSVADIEGARARKARPLSAPMRSFDPSDIAGALAGWKPPHRHLATHATRDNVLNVSDINSYMPRDKTIHEHQQRPLEPEELLERPLDRLERVTEPPTVQPQRPPSAPPSYRTSDPLINRFAQSQYLQPGNVWAAPVTSTGLGQMGKFSAAEKHRKVKAAVDAALAARTSAVAVAEALTVPKDSVKTIWDGCRSLDRDRCGKLSIVEFEAVLGRAGVVGRPGQVSNVLGGMSDSFGLLDYREVTKALMASESRPPKPPSAAAPRQSSQVMRSESARAAYTGTWKSGSARNRSQTEAGTQTSIKRVTVQADNNSSTTEPAWGLDYGASFEAEGSQSPAKRSPISSPMNTGLYGSSSNISAASATVPKSPSTPATTAANGNGNVPRAAGAARVPPDVPQRRPVNAIERREGNKVGESALFFPYKADKYWFAGNDPEGSSRAEAGVYKASDDPSRSWGVRRPFLGDGRELPSSGSAPLPQSTPHVSSADMAKVPMDATLSFAAHTGKASAADVQSAIQKRAAGMASRSISNRPASASPRLGSSRSMKQPEVGFARLHSQITRDEIASVRYLM